jgi:hypothetical protein
MRPVLLFLALLIALQILNAQNPQTPNQKSLEQTILELDSAFWQAYNRCDVEKMKTFFTDDVEFYHDKNGLTTGNATLNDAVKKNLCGNPNWSLRREVVEGSLKVFPLNNYGAILSGEHVFYINETGKKERLDGLAKFTHVWRFKDNTWKMHRVLSYDHGPAPYNKQRKEIQLESSLLKQYTGKYSSPKFGEVNVTHEANNLKLTAGNFTETLRAESPNKFFVKDKNLQFEFNKLSDGKVKITVYENGNVVDELAGK